MIKIKINDMEIQLYRKKIKNLYIRVRPPNGEIWVSAPNWMPKSEINDAIIHRWKWIKRHQYRCLKQKFEQPNQLISGESILIWGDVYQLKIIDDNPDLVTQINENYLMLCAPQNASVAQKLFRLTQYYHALLNDAVAPLILKWQLVIGVQISTWRLRSMKTRWGSCNTKTHRIWLNLELVKKPLACLEYVIVHELVHLLEPSHNVRFKSLMSNFLPDWPQRRALLNNS